ncbi:MAG: sugar phosphate isomerase/epimerase [Clostridia bacterium]|nr:sugar phosphate isomerase/epimerase [Clostridia bacterium]
MCVMISTSMYHSDNFKNVLNYVEKYKGRVGVEIFPRFDEGEFEKVLKECVPFLKNVPVSFHEPSFEIEHTADIHSNEYKKTIHRLSSMIKYGSVMGCRYIVYHHNNCVVPLDKKEEMLKVSQDNLHEVSQLLLPYGISVAVENAGIAANNTMLLNENEFISFCRESVCNVVIDIGHINANGWDLRNVMLSLKNKIISYHIHNNYGKSDEHNRIFDGTFDFNEFIKYYREFTPNADLVLEYKEEMAERENEICEDIDFLFEMAAENKRALA